MNWRAFTTYGVASALMLFVLPFMVLFVIMLASGGGVRPGAMALLFPFVLSMMPTLFASFYVSFRDIFARPEEAQSEQEGDSSTALPPGGP